MFNWTSRLLHWRNGNDVITKGKQTQFIPYDGIYVIARTLGNKVVMTVLNGTSHKKKLHVERYAEVINEAQTATNILTNRKIDITKDVTLSPRGTMILEFENK